MVVRSEAEIAQRRVIARAATQRPVIFPLDVLDRRIVDAGDAHTHKAVFVELPVLVAVAAIPVAAVVVPLIGKADGDAILPKRRQFLDQTVIELAVPLACQERFDGLAALQEFGAIPPAAVGRVRKRDAGRITRIPCVFGHTCLLRCGLLGEGWKRWTAHGCVPQLTVSSRRSPATRHALPAKAVRTRPSV